MKFEEKTILKTNSVMNYVVRSYEEMLFSKGKTVLILADLNQCPIEN